MYIERRKLKENPLLFFFFS